MLHQKKLDSRPINSLVRIQTILCFIYAEHFSLLGFYKAMNTGRNLNIFSWSIVIYLLAGADIKSLGISGLSLSLEHPEVIKYTAIILWLWMIFSHYISSIKRHP